MSSGRGFGGPVRSQDLQLPVPNPLPCDPNYEHPLSQYVPYVVDGSIQKLQIKAQVFTQATQTLCDYVITLATFDSSHALLNMVDASGGGHGIAISTAWNAETKQNAVTIEMDLARIPDSVLYMVGGIVSGRGFAQWPGNRMDIEVKGVTKGNPYQRYDSSEEVSRTLGRRELAELTGTGYAVVALARAGAWWHMYPLRANCPGATDVKGLKELWQGPEFRGFLKGYNWGAHAPDRRRVIMHVSSGHGLAVKDPSLFNKSKGSSDPYCKVYCGLFEETYEVKKKTLNPSWSYDEGPPHSLRAVSASDSRVFLVHVFDHDNNKADDFMGCCYVPVAHAFTLPLGEHYLKLELVPMGATELAHIKQHLGNAEFKRHHSTNIRGYLTIELRTEVEQDPTLYL